MARRTFLGLTGLTLSSIATTGTVSAVEETKRFIVNAKTADKDDLEVIHRLDPVNLLVVRGSEKAVKKLDSNYAPDVTTSYSPQVDLKEQGATDEPMYSFQWDKQAQQIPTVHERTRGEGSCVTVIDTGVDASHPDLNHAINEDLSENFTPDGGDYTDVGFHGTHVAGIIAADDRNENGIVGTAPATDLVSLRVFDRFSNANFGDILAAIVHSAEIGADVANLSLGAYPYSRNGFGSFYGKALNRTMTYANKNGTLLVVAGGNDGADLQKDKDVISLPSEGAQALCVSATGPKGFDPETGDFDEPAHTPVSYTNYGTNAIDIAAPGGNLNGSLQDWVFSTIPTDFGFSSSYTYLYGTSMAAPQVAGAAALIASMTDYSVHSQANGIERLLKQTAAIPDGYDKEYYGSGFIDVLSAVDSC
ncbi:S8 family serine peptidase [Halomicroarcula sp. F28]|uniref:S8 family peptidase n=1 Tax=Haloarcula salinisoli TaxID=2487746 RepID=UPI001C739D3E|nr:S8 family serine peptidase [Halomicroarcula salinisoli]MBX0288511.1 S8 family serine peptidase [Halomicroarcula salinisoli]